MGQDDLAKPAAGMQPLTLIDDAGHSSSVIELASGAATDNRQFDQHGVATAPADLADGFRDSRRHASAPRETGQAKEQRQLLLESRPAHTPLPGNCVSHAKSSLPPPSPPAQAPPGLSISHCQHVEPTPDEPPRTKRLSAEFDMPLQAPLAAPRARRPEPAAPLALTHPNGSFIFPSLSTSEQQDLAREALSQAEDSIVAENIEDDMDQDETDGGYSSDGFSSGSTSAESTVRDYLYENGRRYHRFREGTYNFPNDDVEQEREDMKHAMVKLLCSQKLHFAPIGDHPQEILDMGTGTGIWAIEMGDQFPSARVLGVDLSPIQPDWLPPNVRFLVDDIESPWLYPRNHFDYIHSRHTVMAVRDWMRLFRRAFEHVKPGGWMEIQEIHHAPRSAHFEGAVPADHVVAQFWARVSEGLGALGIDLGTVDGGLLAGMMREAGFTNVTERIFHVPIGTWPRNKVLKTVGLYWRTILLDGVQAIALGPLTRGLRWNRDQVELFLVDVRRAYYDNAALMYMPLHIIYAQKPGGAA